MGMDTMARMGSGSAAGIADSAPARQQEFAANEPHTLVVAMGAISLLALPLILARTGSLRRS
jgi:hypothetical protein